MPSPFNPAAHEFLLAHGYTHRLQPADFDDGTPESGPGYGGHPAYDEYTSAEDRVFVSEGSWDTDFELRDLEAEKYVDEYMAGNFEPQELEDEEGPEQVQPEAEFKAGWAAAQAALQAAGWYEYGYTQGEHTWIHDSYPTAMISCLLTNSKDEGGWVHTRTTDGSLALEDVSSDGPVTLGQGLTGQELVEYLVEGEHA